MNCAKVLINCLESSFSRRKLTFVKNFKISVSCRSEMAENTDSKPSDMESLFDPPPGVRGMKKLDRNAFKKTVNVPCISVEIPNINNAQELLKKYSLRIPKFKSIESAAKVENERFKIYLNPKTISSWNDFGASTLEKLQKLNISEDNFSEVALELGYENWNAKSILKAVLPEEVPPLTSYSVIGHIIHLNIREYLLDYRYLIGEVLFDKNRGRCKTVVFKKSIIDNVYRNFEMELICGEPNYIASVSSNQCQFELDFSKVYWNPRLGTEHQRITDTINLRDILFDIFAGIGPFAIPAAKKGCMVFANDLNPESVKWLRHNIELNKKSKANIVTYNKDGKDFILEDVKEILLKTWKDDLFDYKIHVVMNLPAIAPTFLKYFNKLFKESDLVDIDMDKVKKCLPIINCYFFVRSNECQKTIFEETSEINLSNIKHSFHLVRKVSDVKSMFRVTFSLPFEYLVGEEEGAGSLAEPDEPLAKRICTR